ncbi:putative N-acetyltransferase YafP [Planctomycetes bacterium Pan216]|uniref:Putative N-acetyltransferase YafP n=1 Tax=Kolteria novifilia TaxID=2527975 RepID=A0A518B3K0_9BACT|nr:putative N-acetyltransferase YafP [Planctomycetes bacterium Pan216]
MIIRLVEDADVEQICEIFHTTIHTVNASDYTEEQRLAWSPHLPPADRWRERLSARTTFVADDEGVIAGFGELKPDGYIDCFYCRNTYQRRGVGSQILAALEQAARDAGLQRLLVDVSITARPFFAAKGYRVLRQQEVIIREVALTNFVMEKQLALTPASAEHTSPSG